MYDHLLARVADQCTDTRWLDCGQNYREVYRAPVVDTGANFQQETSIYVWVWQSPALGTIYLISYPVSQCQAIHARSIFPCQDTPDVKSTIDFNINSPLPVMTSGLPIRQSSMTASSGNQLYRFHQSVPIPSYLFAIASG